MPLGAIPLARLNNGCREMHAINTMSASRDQVRPLSVDWPRLTLPPAPGRPLSAACTSLRLSGRAAWP